jgi:hypothetical protein
MNPLSWCPFLRGASVNSTIENPARYDERSFADMKNVPPWKDWDANGGIYNSPAGAFTLIVASLIDITSASHRALKR